MAEAFAGQPVAPPPAPPPPPATPIAAGAAVVPSRPVARPAERGTSGYIPSLDGIRAVAFTMVWVAHAGWGDVVPGGFGVTVFFFLSGYLITTLLRREFEKTGRISLKNFYLRRALRIFPPMYITLAVVVGLSLVGVIAWPFSWQAVGAQALHLTNYYAVLGEKYAYGIPLGTKAFWSLAVEEHFYLVFPLVCLLTFGRRPFRRICWWLLGACGVILAWRCIQVYAWRWEAEKIYVRSDTRVDSILFGCIMALGFNPYLDGDRLRTLGSKAALLALGLAAIGFSLLYRNPDFRESWRYTLQGFGLMPIFYLAITNPGWPVFAWLNWRAVRFVGLLSYTLYLCHHTAILTLWEWWPELDRRHAAAHPYATPITLAASAAIIFAYSAAMYYIVERPCARLRKKLHTD